MTRWAPHNLTPSSQQRKRDRNHSPVFPGIKLRCSGINRVVQSSRGSAGMRTQGSQDSRACSNLTVPDTRGCPSTGGQKPTRGEASPAEPPNTVSCHNTSQGPTRPQQAPGRSQAHPRPPHALGPAWDVPSGVCSGHAGITHHEGPAPPVLAEAVAPPGARGCGAHLPAWRLIVREGTLPPQVPR